MQIIILTILIFLNIIQLVIFLDIILSWLILFWIRIRLKFVQDILSPIYGTIKKTVPTTFGAFDFTPIIVLLIIMFVGGFLSWFLVK